jgi:lactoylglutathione lyase
VPDLVVNIDVADLARAIRFYADALGLRVVRRLGPDIAELEGSSAPIFLIQHPAGTRPHPGASSGRDYARHWTPVHVDFVVPELEPAVARARAAGARVENEVPREFPGGRYVVLADPFGNGFCLLQLVPV